MGQLGQGDTDNRGGPNNGVFEMGDNLLPVDVLGVNSNGLAVESVSTGGSSACALLTGGLLKVGKKFRKQRKKILRSIQGRTKAKKQKERRSSSLC